MFNVSCIFKLSDGLKLPIFNLPFISLNTSYPFDFISFLCYYYVLVVAMEDLCGYVILRGELVEGRVSVEVTERIMAAAGNTHKLTRHSALPKSKFTDLCDTFR